MNNSVVFMFSGQGSQYYQMGKKLFRGNPVFKKWMIDMDDMARQYIGQSVIEHIYDEKKGKDKPFDRLLLTTAAIFMVEYALVQVLLESGIEPDYLLGASLGEIVAAAAAGVIDYDELFKHIIKEAEIIEANCPKAGMMAVIGNLNLYYSTSLINGNSELAAQNYSSHFVISGEKEKLAWIKEFLKEKSVIFQILPVNFGFHSSLIDSAEQPFLNVFCSNNYSRPKIPIVSCVYGDIAKELSKEYMWNVFRRPVRFYKAVQFLENINNHIYLDLGPGGTLTNFVKRNLRKDSQSTAHPIMTPFDMDLENVAKVKNLFLKNYVSFSERMIGQ